MVKGVLPDRHFIVSAIVLVYWGFLYKFTQFLTDIVLPTLYVGLLFNYFFGKKPF